MRNFQTIEETTYDLIVIGGGINGAATARDAALRGLKTILIEKNDFASGTTSWSTRLIHGGLRYLEFFEWGLVRESLREREILLQTAPHLVKPLQLTIPIYGSGSRSYWEIWAGMLLYDALSTGKSLPSHRMLPSKKFRQLFRFVNLDNVKGAAQYYDGQVEYAERLCWEMILAAKAAGATVLNYAEVTALHCESQQNKTQPNQLQRITHLSCCDRLTGQQFIVRGQPKAVVVNTAGPWVDQVCQRGERDDRRVPLTRDRKIGGTKGSHIIVEPFPGAPSTALYGEARSDGRPFFIVPWLGLYLIGTTDIHYEGNLDAVKASDEEIDYLLHETNHVLPTANLTHQDVKFTYSGIRPLPYTEGKSAGSITRKHILDNHQQDSIQNLISLIGGKLTTARQVGEELVNCVYQKMGRSVPPCPTRDQPFPGAIWPNDPQIQDTIARYSPHLAPQTVLHLFTMYGAKAPEVLALTDDAPNLRQPISEKRPDISAQIVYAVQSEQAHTLVDILLRRTLLGMQDHYGLGLLPRVTATLLDVCGWTQAECDRQAQAYRDYIETNCLPDYQLQADSIQQERTVSTA